MLAGIDRWAGMILCLTGASLLLAGPGKQATRPALQQLVNNSDLIVVGSFHPGAADSTTTDPQRSQTVLPGSVSIEELLWGDMFSFLMGGAVAGEEEITVEWQSAPKAPPPDRGQRGIWLLEKTTEGGYRVGEGQFLDLKYRRKVMRALRKDMVILRAGRFQPAASRVVELVFRNAQKRDALVPEYRYEEGILTLHPRVTLTVQAMSSDQRSKPVAVVPVAGGMQELDDQDEIVVQSGEEYRVSLNLEELFNLEPRTHYEVRFQVKGFGKSTLILPPMP
ncbi:MAG: hypothetical protein IID14_06340 [Candidatus Marinimicrobia bacterium]|nr:hypothetical protein [Candidatus Neomarinimicrobiota bacterium]